MGFLNELWIAIGFKADTLKLKEFISAIGDLNMKSVASALGVGTLYEATAKIMNTADNAAMSVWGFSAATGIASKPMQQFSNYAEQMGASSDDARGSLRNLQQGLEAIRWGQGNIMPYQVARIDVAKVKDQFDLLQKITDFLKGPASDADKLYVASQFGLSDSMIAVLKNTDNVRAAMQRQVDILDGPGIESLRKYHAANKELGQSIEVIWVGIASKVSPFINEILKLSTLTARVATGKKDFKGELFGRLYDDIKNIDIIGASRQSILAERALKKEEHEVNKNIKVDINVNGSDHPERVAHLVYKKLNEQSITDTYYKMSKQNN